MTLGRKSTVIGHLGKGHIGGSQHLPDSLNATIEDVLVWGLAGSGLEGARQLPDRKPGGLRQIHELERFAQRCFDVVDHSRQARGIQSRRRRGLRFDLGVCPRQKGSGKRQHSMIDGERGEPAGLNGMLPKAQAQVPQMRIVERIVVKRTQRTGERRGLHIEPPGDVHERGTDE